MNYMRKKKESFGVIYMKDVRGNVPEETLVEFCKLFFKKRETVNNNYTAYELKHIVEDFFGTYITEEELCDDMWIAGFYIDVLDTGVFYISEKSPALSFEFGKGREVFKMYQSYINKEGKVNESI